MFKKVSLIIVAILFVGVLLLPGKTEALEITPAIKEITLIPGEETVAIIELQNDTTESVSLTTEVVNFSAKDETSGEPEYALDAPAVGAALWTTATEGPINLSPDATTEVAVIFSPPASAAPGGHYVGVVFSSVQPKSADNQLTIESKVAVPFLLTVTGSYTESGKIVTFSADSDSYTEGPVKFTLRYQNTGDVHLKPTGKVVLTNMFGTEVKSININTDKSAVLPGSIREFDVASWSDLGNGFGKYTATVTLTSGTVTTKATYDFWVLSITGIIIAVVIILVLIFLIIIIIRAVSKKKPETT